ncbi:unnamed protein product [Calypogeia fissa]
MPRFEERVFISPSQEEMLEAIPGWDGTHQGAGINDDTPSQFAADAEISSQSSPDRVFDVTGSSLCSGPSKEAVELVSPSDMTFPSPRRTTGTVPLDDEKEENDSYNEAFESDRSQSPPRTVSWSLPAGGAAHGRKDRPNKSPTTSTTLNAEVVDEVGTSPLRSKLKLVSEVELSNRASASPLKAAGVKIGVTAELEVDQGATAAEEDASVEMSGRRDGPAIGCKANGGGSATVREANGGVGVGGGGGSKTNGSKSSADCEAQQQQHVRTSSTGIGHVSPQKSSLPRRCPAMEPSCIVREGFGSGSRSAFMNVRRKEKDSQKDSRAAALSGERHDKASASSGWEGGTSFPSADNVLDQIANSVQVNMQVFDKMQIVDHDHRGKEVVSGDKVCKRSRIQHEVDTVERVGEREEVRVDRVATQRKTSNDELGTTLAADDCQGGIQVLSGKEKSRELHLPSRPSTRAMHASNSVDKTGGGPTACATEGGGHCSPSSPPRPPRAVQEKLDKLRGLSGNKRARNSRFDLLRDRLRTERDMVSASTMLEAIRIRSGERPDTTVTADDLLRTALVVGIPLPPPFHENFYKDLDKETS